MNSALNGQNVFCLRDDQLLFLDGRNRNHYHKTEVAGHLKAAGFDFFGGWGGSFNDITQTIKQKKNSAKKLHASSIRQVGQQLQSM